MYQDNERAVNRLGDSFEWDGVRQDVVTESMAEILILGMPAAGKKTLYYGLKDLFDVPSHKSTMSEDTSNIQPFGLFTIVDLPHVCIEDEELWCRIEQASLLIYILDGSVGQCELQIEMAENESVLRLADMQWITRIQAMGKSLLIFLNKADLWEQQLENVLSQVKNKLGVQVLPISTLDMVKTRQTLLNEIVNRHPELVVPLGREVAAFRKPLAHKIIQHSALRSGLIAFQPIPFFDIPVQLSAHVKLVARLAAMYGKLPAHDYCRELLIAGTSSVMLRMVIQQAVKSIPVLGWVVSAVWSASTTLMIGETALGFFEGNLSVEQGKKYLIQIWRYGPIRMWSICISHLSRIKVPLEKLWNSRRWFERRQQVHLLPEL